MKLKEIIWGPWQLTAYVILCVLFFGTRGEASPYVEYKYKSSLDVSGKTSTYTRVGYKFKNNFYMETGDASAETGYKFKLGDLVIKGKVESTNDFEKNGVEVELRYTF
tara:strand:+ start:185 stop:508 length:324 start_codon:yes stop_codon:yes gene_type:complete